MTKDENTLQLVTQDETNPTTVHPAAEAGKNIWLFNIKEDPNEKNDLSDEMPDKVMELLDRLGHYNTTAVPCRFPKPDPKADPKLHGGYWMPWED